jgi:thiopeptide-type bacteriocin biosynthesis protein
MQRTFVLGDKWIYYKWYCGKKTADTILVDIVKPLTEKLLHENLIDQWFFIRYDDPKSHLRIRFRCKQVSNIGMIINEVKKAIDYFVANDLIWKVRTDTYQRELERYGKQTIVDAEQFFFIDSTTCINALNMIEDDELLFLFALKSIDTLLESFNYDTKNKIEFVKPNLIAFKKEFNSDKQLSKQLNKKYASLKEKTIAFMTENSDEDFIPLFNLLENKKKKLNQLSTIVLNKKKLEISINQLLSSYVHMMINRLFRDQQRLHELVSYDFLSRYYNFLLAKNKQL